MDHSGLDHSENLSIVVCCGEAISTLVAGPHLLGTTKVDIVFSTKHFHAKSLESLKTTLGSIWRTVRESNCSYRM